MMYWFFVEESRSSYSHSPLEIPKFGVLNFFRRFQRSTAVSPFQDSLKSRVSDLVLEFSKLEDLERPNLISIFPRFAEPNDDQLQDILGEYAIAYSQKIAAYRFAHRICKSSSSRKFVCSIAS